MKSGRTAKTVREFSKLPWKNHMCEENPIKMLHENSILYDTIALDSPSQDLAKITSLNGRKNLLK